MQEHWESIYRKRPPREMSWFSPHLETSLEFIERAASEHAGKIESCSIIDVGGGASTLVDDLVSRGCRDLTVLDISETAIAASQERIGAPSESIHWIRADVTEVELPPAAYDIWHDRAVFHFLSREEERRAYLNSMLRSLRPGGQAILGVFGPDGPLQCSGLAVVRYSVSSLSAELGPRFHPLESSLVMHTTPDGRAQQFLYCRFALA